LIDRRGADDKLKKNVRQVCKTLTKGIGFVDGVEEKIINKAY